VSRRNPRAQPGRTVSPEPRCTRSAPPNAAPPHASRPAPHRAARCPSAVYPPLRSPTPPGRLVCARFVCSVLLTRPCAYA